MAEFEEKTEQATPRKRERAREKGEVARSRELISVSASGGILIALVVGGERLLREVSAQTEALLRFKIEIEPIEVIRRAMVESLMLLMPYLIAGLLMALLSGFLQGGAVFKPLEVNLERLNPLSGLKRLFSIRVLYEALKDLLKFLLSALVLYIIVKKFLIPLSEMPAMDFGDIKERGLQILKHSTITIFLIFFLLGSIDYLYERFRFERSLRMSRQELKEEFRETEGDPLIRARIRSLQREFARRRMLSEVPKATVVITNPIHIAVALLYKRGETPAPKVVAKGAGIIAERIKEIARAHRVPIYEDKALARALFRLKIDSYIPEELYRAVARIIAYIYRLRGVA